MFYSGKLTQTAFKIITELISILSPFDIPRSFDTCCSIVGESCDYILDFKKQWICKHCDIVTCELNNRFQRKCLDCGNR